MPNKFVWQRQRFGSSQPRFHLSMHQPRSTHNRVPTTRSRPAPHPSGHVAPSHSKSTRDMGWDWGPLCSSQAGTGYWHKARHPSLCYCFSQPRQLPMLLTKSSLWCPPYFEVSTPPTLSLQQAAIKWMGAPMTRSKWQNIAATSKKLKGNSPAQQHASASIHNAENTEVAQHSISTRQVEASKGDRAVKMKSTDAVVESTRNERNCQVRYAAF